MRSRTFMGLAPALGFSVIPTLTCPACLPTLASAVGAVGLTFVAEREYLLWLNLAALLAAVLLLAWRERKWISVPLGLAVAGGTAVMLGKFVWPNTFVWWTGVGTFVLGSAWSSVKRKSTKTCMKCESVGTES